MPRLDLAEGHVVTAAELNEIGAQTVPAYADTAARDADWQSHSPPSIPPDGKLASTADGKVWVWTGGASGAWSQVLAPPAPADPPARTGGGWRPGARYGDLPAPYTPSAAAQAASADRWPVSPLLTATGSPTRSEHAGHHVVEITADSDITVAAAVEAQVLVIGPGGVAGRSPDDRTAALHDGAGGGGEIVSGVVQLRPGQTYQARPAAADAQIALGYRRISYTARRSAFTGGGIDLRAWQGGPAARGYRYGSLLLIPAAVPRLDPAGHGGSAFQYAPGITFAVFKGQGQDKTTATVSVLGHGGRHLAGGGAGGPAPADGQPGPGLALPWWPTARTFAAGGGVGAASPAEHGSGGWSNTLAPGPGAILIRYPAPGRRLDIIAV